MTYGEEILAHSPGGFNSKETGFRNFESYRRRVEAGEPRKLRRTRGTIVQIDKLHQTK